MYFVSKPRIAAEKILQEIKEETGEITYPIDPFKILKEKKCYNYIF